MSNVKIIVITLVKDEAWMLDRFLATCSVFADHIIVSDESTGIDNSLEIYNKYPKVMLHHNSGTPVRGDFRRKFVFDEARKIPCDKRIIIAIDSDEILSANLLHSPEWQTVLAAEPGTLFHLQWVSLWKNCNYYRVEAKYQFGGYNRQIWIDDGVSEIPAIGYQEMHMAYNPLHARTHVYLNEIVCLHYQYCNWERMESKHRYYRAHEKADIGKLSDIAIYRIYGHAHSRKIEVKPSLSCWFDGWISKGIDMTSTARDELTHFDISVLRLFESHGADFFLNQDLWKVDWEYLANRAKEAGLLATDFSNVHPKKTIHSKLFHAYMKIALDVKILKSIEKRIFPHGLKY